MSDKNTSGGNLVVFETLGLRYLPEVRPVCAHIFNGLLLLHYGQGNKLQTNQLIKANVHTHYSLYLFIMDP